MRTLARLMTVASLVVVPATMQSQARPIELGLDAGFTVTLDDPRVTTIGIPAQQFRVGFHRSSSMSIEPTLAINYLSVDGFGDLSTISLGVGALLFTSPERNRGRLYFRPFGGITAVSDGGGSNPNLGVGMGYTAPFGDRRLATRLEGMLNHIFGDGNNVTSLGLSFGLSFFTR